MPGPFCSLRLSRVLIFIQLLFWPALAAILAGTAGIRLNVSSSVPVGLYLVSSRPEARYVEFCPPEIFGQLSIDRGYRRRSAGCPDQGEPMVKPVIAREGDLVEISSLGIRVNGLLVPKTQPGSTDSAGQSLSAWPPGSYRVAAGTIWVASSYNSRSFDSRYFGPIRISDVKNRLRPFWTE